MLRAVIALVFKKVFEKLGHVFFLSVKYGMYLSVIFKNRHRNSRYKRMSFTIFLFKRSDDLDD